MGVGFISEHVAGILENSGAGNIHLSMNSKLYSYVDKCRAISW